MCLMMDFDFVKLPRLVRNTWNDTPFLLHRWGRRRAGDINMIDTVLQKKGIHMQICGCIRDEYDKHERGAGLKINYQTRELNYQLFRYLKIGVILRELNLLAIGHCQVQDSLERSND